MLYKFKSRAAADLIMLEPNGRRVLQIIGKSVDEKKGILQPADMPAAMAALETAIALEEARRRAAQTEAAERGEDTPAEEPVTLRQRLAPFIDMLHRCEQAKKEIVWGV